MDESPVQTGTHCCSAGSLLIVATDGGGCRLILLQQLVGSGALVIQPGNRNNITSTHRIETVLARSSLWAWLQQHHWNHRSGCDVKLNIQQSRGDRSFASSLPLIAEEEQVIFTTMLLRTRRIIVCFKRKMLLSTFRSLCSIEMCRKSASNSDPITPGSD